MPDSLRRSRPCAAVLEARGLPQVWRVDDTGSVLLGGDQHSFKLSSPDTLASDHGITPPPASAGSSCSPGQPARSWTASGWFRSRYTLARAVCRAGSPFRSSLSLHRSCRRASDRRGCCSWRHGESGARPWQVHCLPHGPRCDIYSEYVAWLVDAFAGLLADAVPAGVALHPTWTEL